MGSVFPKLRHRRGCAQPDSYPLLLLMARLCLERREGPGLAEVDVELQLLWVRLRKGPSVRGPERREGLGLVEADVELQLLLARLKGPHVRGPERREGPGLVEVDVGLQLLWAGLSKGPHARGPERREGPGLVEVDDELQLVWVPGETQQGPPREGVKA